MGNEGIPYRHKSKNKHSGGSSAILFLETKVNRLTYLLKNLANQSLGKIQNWEGHWTNCKLCKLTFAYGPPWNNLTQNDPCPNCEATKYMKENP